MNEENDSSDGGTGRQSKVARIIEAYDLQGIGDEMEQRWTDTGDDRMSLRELAAYFNQELLASAMSKQGMQPLGGEVENTYQLLTGEETGEGDKIRIQRRLEREGVDVETLTDDFLTYQAIRTFLKRDRGAEYIRDSQSRKAAGQSNIQRLRGRTATVTESRLEYLRDNDDIDISEFQVIVDVTVLCEECGSRFEFDELLERGGCQCTERIDRNE